MGRRGWVVLLLAFGAACSTQGSTGDDTPVCATTDGGAAQTCLGCAVPSAVWADGGALSCPRSIQDYCDPSSMPTPSTTPPSCLPSDWSSVVASEKQYGSPLVFYECDAVNLATPSWSCGVGTNVLFVYDKASGQLGSVVELGAAGHAGQQTCLAGANSAPMLDLEASHCKMFECFPPDSGLDAGACDL